MSTKQLINSVKISNTSPYSNFNNSVDTTGRINEKLHTKFNKSDVITLDTIVPEEGLDQKVYSAAKTNELIEASVLDPSLTLHLTNPETSLILDGDLKSNNCSLDMNDNYYISSDYVKNGITSITFDDKLDLIVNNDTLYISQDISANNQMKVRHTLSTIDSLDSEHNTMDILTDFYNINGPTLTSYTKSNIKTFIINDSTNGPLLISCSQNIINNLNNNYVSSIFNINENEFYTKSITSSVITGNTCIKYLYQNNNDIYGIFYKDNEQNGVNVYSFKLSYIIDNYNISVSFTDLSNPFTINDTTINNINVDFKDNLMYVYDKANDTLYEVNIIPNNSDLIVNTTINDITGSTNLSNSVCKLYINDNKAFIVLTDTASTYDCTIYTYDFNNTNKKNYIIPPKATSIISTTPNLSPHLCIKNNNLYVYVNNDNNNAYLYVIDMNSVVSGTSITEETQTFSSNYIINTIYSNSYIYALLKDSSTNYGKVYYYEFTIGYYQIGQSETNLYKNVIITSNSAVVNSDPVNNKDITNKGYVDYVADNINSIKLEINSSQDEDFS